MDGFCAGRCGKMSLFPGSPGGRAGVGGDEVLNGERAERRLCQGTKRGVMDDREGAEQKPIEGQD